MYKGGWDQERASILIYMFLWQGQLSFPLKRTTGAVYQPSGRFLSCMPGSTVVGSILWQEVSAIFPYLAGNVSNNITFWFAGFGCERAWRKCDLGVPWANMRDFCWCVLRKRSVHTLLGDTGSFASNSYLQLLSDLQEVLTVKCLNSRIFCPSWTEIIPCAINFLDISNIATKKQKMVVKLVPNSQLILTGPESW